MTPDFVACEACKKKATRLVRNLVSGSTAFLCDSHGYDVAGNKTIEEIRKLPKGWVPW